MFKFKLPLLTTGAFLLLLTQLLNADEKSSNSAENQFKTLLVKPGETIISENFDKDSKKIQSWARYGTKWQITDGVLVGNPASQEYQKAHPGKHSGLNPRLEIRVPDCKDGFLMKFDFKFDSKVDFAHFWLGHHRFKLIIEGDQAILQCSQDEKNKIVKKTPLKAIAGPIQEKQWYSVQMEAHGTKRVIQVSGFEALSVEGISLEKISPVRMSGSAGAPMYIDNFQFIKGAGLLNP